MKGMKEMKMKQQQEAVMANQENSDEFGFSEDKITGFKVKIEAKGLDYKGREISMSKNFDSVEMAAAYMKLINVPCMFDIGVSAVNPCDWQLNLNIIDDQTYQKVIQAEM